ncbi:MAG: fumarylacetoacetate hydrolase family protein [Thermoplasmatales archaeon I-plasma]|jgi:2-keto-4-pentenoate hydratase/2-oxohepta-3-ene-1,7-dioic acid hydratase (catechol pathway)|nr:MAG: fumarylacetoacetate hydrolase family protein [Thermoplasmatales archaeon I-plasma]
MKFLRFKNNGGVLLALEVDGDYISVAELLGKKDGTVDLKDVFGRESEIEAELKKGEYSYIAAKGRDYAPAVGVPGKIICIGLNYRSHIAETEKKVPDNPVIFSKYPNSLAGHMESIRIPEPGLKVDYEGEFGVIIGRTARNVGDDFNRYIFGYFIGNDVSSRELQYRTSQYLLGKTLDGFYPNGPSIVTRDEIPDPQDLWIRTVVNGSLRQDSSTSNMIFSIGKLISYISSYLTLEPGDIISTGTPDGVVLGMKDKEDNWLKPRDSVEVSIEGLGTLKNSFI